MTYRTTGKMAISMVALFGSIAFGYDLAGKWGAVVMLGVALWAIYTTVWKDEGP